MTRRGDVIQVRVTDEEKQRMVKMASAAGLRLSDWVRQCALGERSFAAPGLSRVAGRALDEALDVPSPGVAPAEGAPADTAQRPALPRAPVAEKPLAFSHGHVCPEYGCEWSAPSPNAVCPVHQRKIR